jgi:hypothetical protein
VEVLYFKNIDFTSLRSSIDHIRSPLDDGGGHHDVLRVDNLPLLPLLFFDDGADVHVASLHLLNSNS